MFRIFSFDQSFCLQTLKKVLYKREFLGVSDAVQNNLLDLALKSANSYFDSLSEPLIVFPLKGKFVYRLARYQDELIERKLRLNLKMCTSPIVNGRSRIIKNIKLLLEEGVPYRIYRLDIRSFFESFEKDHILSTIDNIKNLSPHSKILIQSLLNAYTEIGGRGLPRGLSISAILSEILMHDFDQKVCRANDVFYYARYVDDIIIISSAREKTNDFLGDLREWLPPKLKLNHNKTTIAKVEKIGSKSNTPMPIQFDYLGYQFLVKNPKKNTVKHPREVDVDIARKKIKRIKTRVIRSFLSYAKSNDWNLLCDRIAFLTQNFSVHNSKVGTKKVAGIYYSYPLISEGAAGLKELDRFLKNAVLSKKGRVFSITHAKISAHQRRQLLAYSFSRGHSNRSFIYFSTARISQIQSCWIY